MTNVAFLGCAHIHTPQFVNTLKGRTDLKVKSVWDHDPARARKNAEQLSASVVGDFKAVCADPEIGAIIVCAETVRHEELVMPIVAAKKHLFVEKPLGFAARDAAAMRDAIVKAGVIFSTGYFMRGDPKVLCVKQHIAKGSLGKITRIRGSNCHGGALGRWFDTDWRWMTQPKLSGVGAFGDLGTHLLDLMIWMIGDVAGVTAAIDNGLAVYECDELGEGLLRFNNGVIGTLAASWDDVANPVMLMVTGTEGHIAIINDKVHLKSNKVPNSDGAKPLPESELPAAVPAGFAGWLDAIAGKAGAQLVTAPEAAYRNAVMEALYEGAKTKAWVTPK